MVCVDKNGTTEGQGEITHAGNSYQGGQGKDERKRQAERFHDINGEDEGTPVRLMF